MRPVNSFIGEGSMRMLPRPNSRSLNCVERSGSFRKLRYVQVPTRTPLSGSLLISHHLASDLVVVALDLVVLRVVVRLVIRVLFDEPQLLPGGHHLEVAGVRLRNALRPCDLRAPLVEDLHRAVRGP